MSHSCFPRLFLIISRSLHREVYCGRIPLLSSYSPWGICPLLPSLVLLGHQFLARISLPLPPQPLAIRQFVPFFCWVPWTLKERGTEGCVTRSLTLQEALLWIPLLMHGLVLPECVLVSSCLRHHQHCLFLKSRILWGSGLLSFFIFLKINDTICSFFSVWNLALKMTWALER